MSDRLELQDVTWRRVSPKYLVADLAGLLVPVVLGVALAVLFGVLDWAWAMWIAIAFAGLNLIYAAFAPRRIRAIGYQLRDDDLVFRRGILYQRVVAVPYGRMQLVDINRGPLSRALGLSELKFVTAAASTGVVIPGLPEAEADELRDRLVDLAESRRAGL